MKQGLLPALASPRQNISGHGPLTDSQSLDEGLRETSWRNITDWTSWRNRADWIDCIAPISFQNPSTMNRAENFKVTGDQGPTLLMADIFRSGT